MLNYPCQVKEEVKRWIRDYFEENGKGCFAVIGISGGLDSTLALLVTVRAFDLCGFDRSGIHCITMPCFGTTDRTYNNAVKLTKQLGCSFDYKYRNDLCCLVSGIGTERSPSEHDR